MGSQAALRGLDLTGHRTVIHVSSNPDVVSERDELLLAQDGVVLERVPDCYTALAMIIRDQHAAVIVDLDGLRGEDVEFFELMSQRFGHTTVHVHGFGKPPAHREFVLRMGARLLEDVSMISSILSGGQPRRVFDHTAPRLRNMSLDAPEQAADEDVNTEPDRASIPQEDEPLLAQRPHAESNRVPPPIAIPVSQPIGQSSETSSLLTEEELEALLGEVAIVEQQAQAQPEQQGSSKVENS